MKFAYRQRKMKVVALVGLVALPLVFVGILIRLRFLYDADLTGTWKRSGKYDSSTMIFDAHGNYYETQTANGSTEATETYAKYKCEGNTILINNVQVYEDGRPYCFAEPDFCDYDIPNKPFSITMQFRSWNRMSVVRRTENWPDSAEVWTKVK